MYFVRSESGRYIGRASGHRAEEPHRDIRTATRTPRGINEEDP